MGFPRTCFQALALEILPDTHATIAAQDPNSPKAPAVDATHLATAKAGPYKQVSDLSEGSMQLLYICPHRDQMAPTSRFGNAHGLHTA